MGANEHEDTVLDLIDTSGHWLDFNFDNQFSDDAPPDRLVRFVPIEQYVSILTSQKILFPRATDYEDPLECSFSWEFCNSVYEGLLESADEPEFSLPGDIDREPYLDECRSILEQRVRSMLEPEADRWFVSCWHAGDVATDLLWRAYSGHKGVAISCDGALLLQQLESTIRCTRNALSPRGTRDGFAFLHGYVNYEPEVPTIEASTEDDGPTVTATCPAFRKDRYFRLDEEYRFGARLDTTETAYYFADALLDLEACGARVSTSPLCPYWLVTAIEELTKRLCPSVACERISLGD